METPTLRMLVAAGIASSAVARPTSGGFLLIISIEDQEHVLSTQRHRSRVFRKLDTLATYARAVGLQHLIIDLHAPALETPTIPQESVAKHRARARSP